MEIDTTARITPAGAGKTFYAVSMYSLSADHPRRCGENQANLSACRQTARITPAGAGKTRFAFTCACVRADHPRRCGENFCVLVCVIWRFGSPPQVRGKLAEYILSEGDSRITPAGAGKTPKLYTITKTPPDHPRRCGENSKCGKKCAKPRGSPPQVRGKPKLCGCIFYNTRITPAGAGKTQCEQSPSPARADHPRRCGENCKLPLCVPPGRGSPPQVRGKPADCCMMQGMARITPAGAGKTACQAGCTPILPDHPRGCGENGVQGFYSSLKLGSPPRMRGKPRTQKTIKANPRITPADAGKTGRQSGHIDRIGGSPPRMRGKPT